MGSIAEASEWYRWFARHEATGRSPLYAEFAFGVAEDSEFLESLCELPPDKRQPNLLLAAVRRVCGVAQDWAQFRSWYFAREDAIRGVMRDRRTQTNEPGRCAPLVLALARLPQPLAIIEVGAAAGLCLLPDRYRYSYGEGEILFPTSVDGAPTFRCAMTGPAPLPQHPLEIVWRAGLDLEPIDLRDDDQVDWLETLVWPEQHDRLDRLRAAIRLARQEPPRVVRGDLRHDLAALAEEAPTDATLVVFHTATLLYLQDRAEREAFGDQLGGLGAVWIANEPVGILETPGFSADDPELAGRYILSQDRKPLALGDPHGTSLHWL